MNSHTFRWQPCRQGRYWCRSQYNYSSHIAKKKHLLYLNISEFWFWINTKLGLPWSHQPGLLRLWSHQSGLLSIWSHWSELLMWSHQPEFLIMWSHQLGLLSWDPTDRDYLCDPIDRDYLVYDLPNRDYLQQDLYWEPSWCSQHNRASSTLSRQSHTLGYNPRGYTHN